MREFIQEAAGLKERTTDKKASALKSASIRKGHNDRTDSEGAGSEHSCDDDKDSEAPSRQGDLLAIPTPELLDYKEPEESDQHTFDRPKKLDKVQKLSLYRASAGNSSQHLGVKKSTNRSSGMNYEDMIGASEVEQLISTKFEDFSDLFEKKYRDKMNEF